MNYESYVIILFLYFKCFNTFFSIIFKLHENIMLQLMVDIQIIEFNIQFSIDIFLKIFIENELLYIHSIFNFLFIQRNYVFVY